MKIEFSEVAEIFESNEIWICSRENLWYKKAWLALEKEGLTTYENYIERSLGIIRAFTLIMIYMEYCDLAFNEEFWYEFPDWKEYSELSPFRIGQIFSKVFKDEDLSVYDDYEALDEAFVMLVDNERYKVFDAVLKNIGPWKESAAFVAMYLTCVDMSEDEDEHLDIDEDYNEELISEKLTIYEKYERDIEKYFDRVFDDISLEDSEAFYWLTQGTYRIR